MTKATEALQRLYEGNRRFVAEQRIGISPSDAALRAKLLAEHEPIAIVLGCSDSRVPVELVFDQGLGDLFVIRVAGNIVAPSQICSVEFATAKLWTRLVVVMGHSQCGAVTTALEEILGHTTSEPGILRPVVDRVRLAIESRLAEKREWDFEDLLRDAVRANILASVEQLYSGSNLIQRLVKHDGLLLLGAEYSLKTGIVTFLGDIPD